MLLKEISQNSIIKNNLLKYKKLSEELNNYVFLAVPGVEQKRNEALAKQRNIEILIGNEIKKLFLREPEFEDLAEQIESELMK